MSLFEVLFGIKMKNKQDHEISQLVIIKYERSYRKYVLSCKCLSLKQLAYPFVAFCSLKTLLRAEGQAGSRGRRVMRLRGWYCNSGTCGPNSLAEASLSTFHMYSDCGNVTPGWGNDLVTNILPALASVRSQEGAKRNVWRNIRTLQRIKTNPDAFS